MVSGALFGDLAWSKGSSQSNPPRQQSQSLGRHREALEAYAELVQLEKSPRRKSRQLFAMALQYEALGEWYQALDTIDECLNDGEIILLTHKARILQKAGRETDAQKTYHQFLQAVDEKIIQTQDPAYYFQKATVLEKLGRTDQAIASLRDLLKFGKNLTPQRKAEAQDRLRTLERTK
jgi:tetratricopeptide (TPR) repeat protein